jgi:hypothetical protein
MPISKLKVKLFIYLFKFIFQIKILKIKIKNWFSVFHLKISESLIFWCFFMQGKKGWYPDLKLQPSILATSYKSLETPFMKKPFFSPLTTDLLLLLLIRSMSYHATPCHAHTSYTLNTPNRLRWWEASGGAVWEMMHLACVYVSYSSSARDLECLVS